MFRLDNTLRDYAWGSTTLLPALTGREPDGTPEAELWMGAHPGAPSRVHGADGVATGLDAAIAANPEHMLGEAAHIGRLPFLLKLLAAGEPLSIQAHPTLEQARAGFAAEEAAGVPAHAPRRNYKDDNHKPEMVVALTEFAALCGFRRPEESALTFHRIAQFMTEYADGDTTAASAGARHLAMLLDDGDLEAAFTEILAPDSVWASEGTVAGLLQALSGMPDLILHDDAIATAVEVAKHHPDDPGVLVTLLLNRVDLMPGQAIHLPAGNVHAYLKGLGVEVMASSDNVLRGGLTSKHVDVPELQRVVDFTALPAPYTTPVAEAEGVLRYRPPFAEFELAQVCAEGTVERRLTVHGPAIVVATEGTARVTGTEGAETLAPGESVFLAAAETAAGPLSVRAADGQATVYVASVPATSAED